MQQDYPALTQEHLVGARLFADRRELLRQFSSLRGGVVAEIGVAAGDFSEFMLEVLEPRVFVAFDIFTMHHHPVIWGRPSSELFEGMTQLEFYRKRFADRGDQVIIEEGLSHETLARYADATFDLVYIDADHTYEGVKRDAQLAKTKIKRDGVLVFNDYTMYDHLLGEPYGIVPVVNELVMYEDWRVIGLGLERNMFCDIAVTRRHP